MLKPALVVLREDYAALAALVASLSQLGALRKLLEPTTTDLVVYMCSAIIASITGFFTWKYAARSRRERFHREQARPFRALSIAFAGLSLVALVPAGYRILYVHTTLLTPTPETKPASPIIGKLTNVLMSSAHAAGPDVQVSAMLDISRTSVRCEKSIDAGVPAVEVTEWGKCLKFSVPDEDLQRFLFGWRYFDPSDENIARNEFERRYWARIIKPAHRAMLAIPRLASNPAVRNYEFPIKVGLYHEWKQRLFSENLLPTAAEWSTLSRDTPELAAALRRYFVEIVGVLDPFFIITVQNSTAKPVQLSNLLYTAKFVTLYKALLLTGYERPRYVLQLQSGTHGEPMIPPVIVGPNSISTFDFLITMKEPRPGHEYRVTLNFGTPEAAKLTSLPAANFVFWQGKE